MSFLQLLKRSITTPWLQMGFTGFVPQRPLILQDILKETVAGQVAVTKHTVMGYPPTRRAVLEIANAAAALPIHAMRYDNEGDKEPDWNHPWV